ncbi:hypothetical protein BJ166DRAFT_104068 [Pestalotiopsis sp. NC0098]|nr:hypothetical protein BJ166DRAFT_104068 [Pestalotiopsis sp. NC0098]
MGCVALPVNGPGPWWLHRYPWIMEQLTARPLNRATGLLAGYWDWVAHNCLPALLLVCLPASFAHHPHTILQSPSQPAAAVVSKRSAERKKAKKKNRRGANSALHCSAGPACLQGRSHIRYPPRLAHHQSPLPGIVAIRRGRRIARNQCGLSRLQTGNPFCAFSALPQLVV